MCTVTAKYVCTAERDQLLIWEVSLGQRLLFSPLFHEYMVVGTNYILNSISDIRINSEFSGINSTNIYSTLSIVYNISFSGIQVYCNNIFKNPIELIKSREPLNYI